MWQGKERRSPRTDDVPSWCRLSVLNLLIVWVDLLCCYVRRENDHGRVLAFVSLLKFSSGRMRAVQHAVRRIHVNGLSRTVAIGQWRCRAGTDLITGRRFIESYSDSPFKHRPRPRPILSPSTMSSADSLAASLASLSITPAATVFHADTNSPAAWRDALLASPSVPESFELIKTLVYKPKTAKTATPVPVVVIARDETETSSSALGKKLNLKELRLASEDLLADFFGLDKNSRAFPDRFCLPGNALCHRSQCRSWR